MYGYEGTKKALEAKQASTLILNDTLQLEAVTYKCNACGSTIERMELAGHREAKHEDGGTLTIVAVKDAIEELIDMADKTGAETVFVSSESSYGKEFMMGFKGIGALLRYR